MSGGAVAPSLQLVGVDNEVGGEKLIDDDCRTYLGADPDNPRAIDPVSADGEEVFFSTGCETATNSVQLFMRVDGSHTVEVSRPLTESCPDGEVPCPGAATRASAEFKGASKDGSRVFFTTAAPLTGEADATNNLYMAEIGCPGGAEECAREPDSTRGSPRSRASRAAHSAEVAEVQGVTAVSPDGSHVYFVAHGVLSTQANAEGAVPVKGAENMYVYENDERYPSGHLAFVADLCSGPQTSGEWTDDTQCPSDLGEGAFERNDAHLWSTTDAEAQTTPDGRFLVFSSYGQLVASDTDTARDVYRYDAERGVLDRVSVGEEGADANGNDDRFDATISPYSYLHAISEDGTRIVFTAAGPLSEQASNGLANVYEWHEQPGGEGVVWLVSTGNSSEPVEQVAISPSGRDIFFLTSQGLVPQDTDGQNDIYDARLGGGFPVRPSAEEHCEGEACYGPLTNPAPLLVPGSAVQVPGQNASVPAPVPTVTPKKASVKCAKGKKLSHNKCVKDKSKKKAKRAGDRRRGKR